jgi:opacity protein-like surface antigen
MKNSLRCLSLAVSAAALAAPAARSQTQPAGGYQGQSTVTYQTFAPFGFYLDGDVGGNLVQDLHIRGAGGGKNQVDPGARADVAFGIKWSPYVATEIETGVMGNWLDTSAGQPLSAVSSRAYLNQFPLLGNVIFSAPCAFGLTPYIGGGAGGIGSVLHSRLNGDWDHDGDFTFAYQGEAGLKFAITRSIDVGVAYKFLGTLDHTWFNDDPARRVATGNIYNHSILATFTWTF